MMGRLNWRGVSVGSCVLVFIVHAAILFVAIPEFSSRITPLYNQNKSPDGYDILARSLVEGNGYRLRPETSPTLMREPGYPIFLAGIFRVFGPGIAAVKLANMVLALASAWLMIKIARKLSASRVLVLVPPLLFLFHPGILIAESRGGVEILFTLLLVLFMLAVYGALDSNKGRDYVLAGAALGLVVSVKSTPILFPCFFFAYLLVFERLRLGKLAICRNVLLMITAMFVVLSPWIIRNYSLTGRFVPTASVLGVSAQAGQYIGTHISPDSRWVDLDQDAARERNDLARQLGYPFEEGYYQCFYSSRDELRFSDYLLKGVIREYKKSPLLFLRVAGANLFNFWFAGKTWKSTGINELVQLPFLILATVGTVLCVRNNRIKMIGPLVLLIIYIIVASVPILAQARYSVPIVPFLSILACIPVAAAMRGDVNLWLL